MRKPDIKEIIAANIRKYRKLNGLTQRELGLKLGMPENQAQNRVWQWENTKSPSFRSPEKKTLERISSILNVSYAEIVSEEIPPSEMRRVQKFRNHERQMLDILKEDGIYNPYVLRVVLSDWKRLTSRRKSK